MKLSSARRIVKIAPIRSGKRFASEQTVNDEEAMFETWFHMQRRKTFDEVPDYGKFEDHPTWGMGAYRDMKKAWMARASLSVSAAKLQE